MALIDSVSIGLVDAKRAVTGTRIRGFSPRRKTDPDTMLIQAALEAAPEMGRKALARGADVAAQDYLAMRTLVETNSYNLFDAFEFSYGEIRDFAERHIETATTNRKNQADTKILDVLLRIHLYKPRSLIDRGRIEEIQKVSIQTAPIATIKALLNAHRDGFNTMLNHKRELTAAGDIGAERNRELDNFISEWVKNPPSRLPPFRPWNAWSPDAKPESGRARKFLARHFPRRFSI